MRAMAAIWTVVFALPSQEGRKRRKPVTTLEAIKVWSLRVWSLESKARTRLDSRLRTSDSRLLGAAQRQKRNFGQTTVAHGQDDCAQAARDVDLRLAAARESAKYAAAHAARCRVLGAPSDLPAVRVARKHKVNPGARGASKDDGVVR